MKCKENHRGTHYIQRKKSHMCSYRICLVCVCVSMWVCKRRQRPACRCQPLLSQGLSESPAAPSGSLSTQAAQRSAVGSASSLPHHTGGACKRHAGSRNTFNFFRSCLRRHLLCLHSSADLSVTATRQRAHAPPPVFMTHYLNFLCRRRPTGGISSRIRFPHKHTTGCCVFFNVVDGGLQDTAK